MILHEQEKLTPQDAGALLLERNMSAFLPSELGINYAEGNFWTSYYVGACRIHDQEVVVLPKRNLDFMTLFASALTYAPTADDFSSYYGVDWESEATANTHLYQVLTPLLVMHYLTVLNKLVQAGLKRGYVTRTQNLRGQIKGRVMPLQHWRENVLPKREDRFMCRFQEFTVDIPVNRLLKRALEYSLIQLSLVCSRTVNLRPNRIIDLQRPLNEAFSCVSIDVQLHEVRTEKVSKLNRYYTQAVQLAKQILRHQENNIGQADCSNKVPMFWIDMSRLFEVYALQRMRDVYGEDVLYQQHGSFCTICDYLHVTERLIIDAKYKYWYGENLYANRKALVDDIREISGYANDTKLREKMIDGVSEPTCVILYPSGKEDTIFPPKMSDALPGHEISEYMRFYRLPIQVPLLGAQ